MGTLEFRLLKLLELSMYLFISVTDDSISEKAVRFCEIQILKAEPFRRKRLFNYSISINERNCANLTVKETIEAR